VGKKKKTKSRKHHKQEPAYQQNQSKQLTKKDNRSEWTALKNWMQEIRYQTGIQCGLTPEQALERIKP
jgi:hypothetical protein